MRKWFSVLGRYIAAQYQLGLKRILLNHHMRRLIKKEDRIIQEFERALTAQGKALRNRGYLSRQSLKHLTLHLADELHMQKCQIRKVTVELIDGDFFIDLEIATHNRTVKRMVIV
ncbi:hypothetical protein JOAD_118 [Erwinia phage vB_EamM_Joad]|uniref:Uncharacterized protein n=1 Tax=Erwinia phage vB_EamM_Joad TaxID=2026081 RepID=A0A223LHB2_9CAUD|nr:hypothetical protein JOAD_118 [Erwinia phage vB_EamM_Joad]